MNLQLGITILLLFIQLTSFAQELIFKGGHSHNDYHQKYPLKTALKNNMVSIEADVFYIDNQLLVGHEQKELQPQNTLENLYLKPLFDEFQKKGNLFTPLILMIDFKAEGEKIYSLLKTICQPYESMLTVYQNDKVERRAVTIIISGDRPVEILNKEKKRYAFIDGRLDDLEHDINPKLIPLISADWFEYFKYDGEKEILKSEIKQLKHFVSQCHDKNIMLRFWGTAGEGANAINFWNVFNEVGVDLIGTDNPKEFYDFIRSKKK